MLIRELYFLTDLNNWKKKMLQTPLMLLIIIPAVFLKRVEQILHYMDNKH